MTIALYKKGSDYKVRGHMCQVGKFPNEELEARLKEGWSTSPAKAYRADVASVNNALQALRKEVMDGLRYADNIEDVAIHLQKLQIKRLPLDTYHEHLATAQKILHQGIKDTEDKLKSLKLKKAEARAKEIGEKKDVVADMDYFKHVLGRKGE